jgi:hypothetical protein
MRVIELLVNLPSPHPRAPARLSTPEVLQAKEHAPTPSPSIVFTFGLAVSPLRRLGVHQFKATCQVFKKKINFQKPFRVSKL